LTSNQEICENKIKIIIIIIITTAAISYYQQPL